MTTDERKQKAKFLEGQVELTEGVTADLKGGVLTLKGPKGEQARDFTNPQFTLELDNNTVKIKTKKSSKRDKMILGTNRAHIRNMNKGVTEGFNYELQICSGHFPMNVSVAGKELIVKNLYGEKFPRKIKIIDGADVKVNDTKITITSTSKEIAGQQSANIEEGCKRPGFDRRIFQDGIYIIKKD